MIEYCSSFPLIKASLRSSQGSCSHGNRRCRWCACALLWEPRSATSSPPCSPKPPTSATTSLRGPGPSSCRWGLAYQPPPPTTKEWRSDNTYITSTHKQKSLNVLRPLTNTSSGHSKEDITQVYKQYIRPILSCAHPSWEPRSANSHIERLQTTQSSTLQVATGCTSYTPIHHLHDETLVLPIRQHRRM